jgi:acetylornithine aminotransferase/acetylornithine/N-succinyldiaminopimelate aminotransferase
MSLANVKKLEAAYLLGIYNRYEVLIDRGSGPYLFDRSNKRYLDLMAGIGVNALGYGDPRILRVLRKQIKKPIHISNLLYHDYQGRLGERLVQVSGLDRVFFTNSGTESVEGCLKFARVYANRKVEPTSERRYRVLALEGSFHGRSLGSLSATNKQKYREPFEPLVPGFEFVRFNDVADLESKFSDDVCGVIIETMQGEGGVRPVSEEYYRRARRLTRDSGCVLICDEIQCGLGRTGRWFAFHKFADPNRREELPDLVSVAKPLGVGIPLGAVLMKEDLARTIEVGTHGTTFGGGPLACRLSLELFRIFEEDSILEHVVEVGRHFRRRLEELTDLPIVEEVRGEGLMLALELGVAGQPVVRKLLAEGFIVNCTRERVLRMLPPLIITSKQVDRFVKVLRSLLENHNA